MTMIFQYAFTEVAENFQTDPLYVALVLEIFWLFSVPIFKVDWGWKIGDDILILLMLWFYRTQ